MGVAVSGGNGVELTPGEGVGTDKEPVGSEGDGETAGVGEGFFTSLLSLSSVG